MESKYTPREKRMIVNAYRFFEAQKAEGLFKGTRTSEIVGAFLNCHPNTVDTVMRAERESPGTNFETNDSNRGRERDYELTEIEPIIRIFIESENKLARPTTAVRIRNHLRDKPQLSISERRMQRVLGELNFHQIRGENRHIYAESEANIAFRTSYLRKVANRVGTAVSRPEVYLDESFCNVNHVVSKTWLTSEKIRYGKSGKGDRACIIAAGIVTSRGRVTSAKFVEGSIECWNASSKRKNYDPDDYHGNFNSEMFERWFEALCTNLMNKYGFCNIHMDGAGYNKRQTNENPTTRSTRAWLEDHLSTVALLVYNRAANRDVLLSLAKLNPPIPIYAANTIATGHGHQLYYTPLYHPTLQPIESIWGLVKNRIAMDPPKSGSDAVAKVLEQLAPIKPAEWLARFRHVQEIEDKYLEAADDLES